MSVDQFENFSVDRERSENLKRRVKSTDGILNAQNKRTKNGTKPLDKNDLATKQYTDEISESWEKFTKISSLENKIEFYNKRADSADQIFC